MGTSMRNAINSTAPAAGPFRRWMMGIYGLGAYGVCLVALVYAMGFVGGVLVPKAIDSGPVEPVPIAIAFNCLLLGAFAIQHTIMARPAFKEWVTRRIPRAIERSTFVLVASCLLLLLYWQWRPMPEMVWRVENEWGRLTLTVTYWLGWSLVLFSSFLINHFDLFGLRQVYLAWKNRSYEPLRFRTTVLYRLVRHPLLLGFLIAFWSAPDMSEGRLLFAVMTTAYILVGIQFEEHDLKAVHGDIYRQYQEEVPMLIPYRAPKGMQDLTGVPHPPAKSARLRT